MEMTPLFDRAHIDLNRPPVTKGECCDISSAKGAIRRALNTVKRQSTVLAKFKDRSDKPSNSGMLINASLKCFASAAYWLGQGVDILESALKYAKEGK